MSDENKILTIQQETRSSASTSVVQTVVEIEMVNENASSSHVAYNEMADVPVQFIDPVAEVQKNLIHLQEVHSRMKFMMREVRFLLKI